MGQTTLFQTSLFLAFCASGAAAGGPDDDAAKVHQRCGLPRTAVALRPLLQNLNAHISEQEDSSFVLPGVDVDTSSGAEIAHVEMDVGQHKDCRVLDRDQVVVYDALQRTCTSYVTSAPLEGRPASGRPGSMFARMHRYSTCYSKLSCEAMGQATHMLLRVLDIYVNVCERNLSPQLRSLDGNETSAGKPRVAVSLSSTAGRVNDGLLTVLDSLLYNQILAPDLVLLFVPVPHPPIPRALRMLERATRGRFAIVPVERPRTENLIPALQRHVSDEDLLLVVDDDCEYYAWTVGNLVWNALQHAGSVVAHAGFNLLPGQPHHPNLEHIEGFGLSDPLPVDVFNGAGGVMYRPGLFNGVGRLWEQNESSEDYRPWVDDESVSAWAARSETPRLVVPMPTRHSWHRKLERQPREDDQHLVDRQEQRLARFVNDGTFVARTGTGSRKEEL